MFDRPSLFIVCGVVLLLSTAMLSNRHIELKAEELCAARHSSYANHVVVLDSETLLRVRVTCSDMTEYELMYDKVRREWKETAF